MLAVAGRAVCSTPPSFNRFAIRPPNVNYYAFLLAIRDVEHDNFPIANTSSRFVVAILPYGSFVDEHVLTCVITVYESVTPLDVILLYGS